jgi:hypothetical protein
MLVYLGQTTSLLQQVSWVATVAAEQHQRRVGEAVTEEETIL